MIDEWLRITAYVVKFTNIVRTSSDHRHTHGSKLFDADGLPIGEPAGIFLIYLDLNPSSSLVHKNVYINN